MSGDFFFALEGPLDTMPTERQMRTANFGGFADLVRTLGSDPQLILERHGIDPGAIRDPDSYIDCKSLVDVLEYCSTRFNDSLFGLRLAQRQDPDVYGAVTALCRAAATFREAVDAFVTYIPVIHAPTAALELVEGREIVELRWHVRNDLGANFQAAYQATMLDLKLFRSVGGRDFRPSYVNLTGETRARDIAEIESKYGCRFNARAPYNAIAFPSAMMDRPVASANRLLFRLLGGYLDRVRAASRVTIVERVEDYVTGALPSGSCSIERCARKLGTSVRSLQASLSEHDVRFSDILEKKRIEFAKVYLQQNEVPLEEVAALLGYSEQSSFTRAFRRWTGVTPQRYRLSVAADDPARDLTH
jgi:AraC-like DNA-binding protein